MMGWRMAKVWLMAGWLLATAAWAQTEGAVPAEGELRSQPVSADTYDDYYTIQIGAFSSQQQATEFARKLSLPAEQMGIARIMVNERILYVLAYGMYPDKATADQAVATVCGGQGLDGCWARSLGGVRELSRSAQAERPAE